MQIFVENIEDDILFLTFYCFSWWISIFEVNGCLPFTRKTGWSRVVVNGTRQISKGNFHGNALVPFQRQEIIERTWNEVVIQDGGRDAAGKGKAS